MKNQNLGRTVCTTLVSLLFPAFVCSIQAEEKEKKFPTVKNEKDGAEMILIPGGSFLMGSTRAEVDAQFRDTGLPGRKDLNLEAAVISKPSQAPVGVDELRIGWFLDHMPPEDETGFHGTLGHQVLLRNHAAFKNLHRRG